ncbi:MAG TPA: hypothetical protein VFV31_02705 [Chitinophagaceae bacterium]|nr:hypothetical protein [Chitinophagaceae bacterium]
MKKFLLVLTAALSLIACKKVYVEVGTDGQAEDLVLSGTYKRNITLTSGNTYLLDGLVYIDSGYAITIQPGTTLQGRKGTNSSLIIKRGAKIFAVGTPAQPIVFTSSAPEGQKRLGDWGGLVILGKARNNGSYNGVNGVMEIEGGINNANGDGLHGGNNDDDNSGIVKYVRLEFGGYPFQPDREINGLTCGSVGRGTEIDFVQVSYCNDDAYEFFGGTVNAKHLISFRNLDDDFDTDNGYRGKIQFGIAVRDTAIADGAAGGASNGFETDNDGSGSAVQPFTAPVFSNMTIIGPLFTPSTTIAAPFRRGAHIRRNSRMSLFNSVIMGWPSAGAGVLIDGTTTEANAANNDLEMANNIIAGCPTALRVNTGSTFNISSWFNDAVKGNNILTTNTDVSLVSFNSYTGFNPSPAAGSPLLGGASFSSTKLAGMQTVSYRGAVGSGDNWWQGWTRFFNMQ